MDDIIRVLKQNKGPLIKLAKKALAWWKKRKAQTAQGGAQAGGQYGQQGQQQQQYYGQQEPYQGQQQYQGQQPYQGQQYGGPPQGAWGGAPSYDHPPPQGHYQAPSQAYAPPQTGVKPNHPNYHDNEVNQKNERYRQLRADAHREGDLMAKCFDNSHKAYSSGDAARAKQLSNEGHQHKQRMDELNQQAADWIFKANNEDSGPNEVDLHGLYVAEAVQKTEQAIRDAQQKGMPELRVIVGKGMHSPQHIAKIKPAVEKLMQENNLAAELDRHNAGVLIVHLNGGGGGGAFRDSGFTRDLAQQATGNEEQCSIM